MRKPPGPELPPEATSRGYLVRQQVFSKKTTRQQKESKTTRGLGDSRPRVIEDLKQQLYITGTERERDGQLDL